MDQIRLVKIRQCFEAPTVPDLAEKVRDEVGLLLQRYRLESGSRVAITAGSRGINDAVEVYQAAVELLRKRVTSLSCSARSAVTGAVRPMGNVIC